jgi:hypothetical protein
MLGAKQGWGILKGFHSFVWYGHQRHAQMGAIRDNGAPIGPNSYEASPSWGAN